jgi:hypothetical protein
MSFALLYKALNLPSLKSNPILEKSKRISSRRLARRKSFSSIPNSLKLEGNRMSIASGSSP